MSLYKITSRKTFICLISAIIGILPAISCAEEETEIQQIYSWKEKVRVYPSGIEFRAKLDSGAKTSSLHAINIEEFERDGKEWVRFTVENLEDEKETLEREIVRHVRIKEHDGSTQRRVVVKLGICMGTMYKEVEVNLVDRSNFTTRMLIGRSYMEDHVLIDPSNTYTHPPMCERKPIDE